VVLRQMKRRNSLKEPSRSIWEDLCFLEEDSVEKFGKASLGMVLGKSGNAGMLKVCVRENRYL
jgi:hypothetical protein